MSNMRTRAGSAASAVLAEEAGQLAALVEVAAAAGRRRLDRACKNADIMGCVAIAGHSG